MAHWYHRNPIKATCQENFALPTIASIGGNARKLISDIRAARAKLLVLFGDANNTVPVLESALNDYLSLLRGLIEASDDKGGESKLRYSLRFKWTNSLLGNGVNTQQDAVYELCGVLINAALWYTKRAALLAAADVVSPDQAKEVHTCLRTAAGVFGYVRDAHASSLADSGPACGDCDTNMLSAYAMQCTAEAQEITMARAVELKHNSSLISALALETSRIFKQSSDYLLTLTKDSEDKQSKVAKWRRYLDFKESVYLSYAHCYHGQVLLDQDRCGDGIRSLREAKSLEERAVKLGEDYAKTKGAGATAKPWKHPFFLKLGPKVEAIKTKVEHENGFIYFQKVPEELPEMEVKATHGLVEPLPFSLPNISPLWNPQSYLAFEIQMQPSETDRAKEREANAKSKEELPPVAEREIPGTQNAKSESGCVIQ